MMFLYHLFMENNIDLVGDRFSRWFVMKKLDRRHGATYYECRCDCGTIREVNGGSLRRKKSQSCGCLLAEVVAEARLNDLTGQVFGKLTVIERAENSSHGDATWKCSCACGSGSTVRSCNLVSGNTASCGCARKNRETVRAESTRAKSNAAKLLRYRSDSKYNINAKMANAIRISLRRKGTARKTGRWCELVGYTVDELRRHLEATLPAGFTWQHFLDGAMEIDHRIPLAAFNYKDAGDLDFKHAWALSNLRLITALENQQKKDKLSAPFQPSLSF